jgi:hypothetical protein
VDEVRKGIAMGYILVNVFVFWVYEITCFDSGTNSGGLFAEYVNIFLKFVTGIVRLPFLGSE